LNKSVEVGAGFISKGRVPSGRPANGIVAKERGDDDADGLLMLLFD